MHSQMQIFGEGVLEEDSFASPLWSRQGSRVSTQVLVVEDNKADFLITRDLLENKCQPSGIGSSAMDLRWVSSLRAALQAIQEEDYDIILVDLTLPDAQGLEAFHELHDANPEVPIVVLTGLDDELLASRAITEGAQDYLVKGHLNGTMLARAIVHTIERHRVIRELEYAKYKAETATKFKSDFLANMSHEIRTPLTPIIGFADTLRDPNLSEAERQKGIEAIVRSCNHLLRIVNDVLDLSKIEAGKMPIHLTPCSPFVIVSEVIDLLSQKAQEKSITLQTDISYPIPATMICDPIRLKQILVNLVGNAIKFTRKGGVTVGISYREKSGRVLFTVKDTGIGLGSREQAIIFKPFSQAHESTLVQFGGSGLGLAISKELAERLNGSISLKSIRGEGSTFTVNLPLGDMNEPELLISAPLNYSSPNSEEQGEVPLLSGRVLLAEDGPDNQSLISYFLRKSGVDVVIVENGKLAIERASREEFDLILMDMQMPVLNGYDAVKALRAEGSKVPILALTAKALTQDIEICLAIGCNDHLAKPFRRADFYSKISNYLKHKSDLNEPMTAMLEETNPEYVKIILGFVDRLPSVVSQIHEAFQNSNHVVVEELAHRLKSAHLFGFPALSNVAQNLETSASAGLRPEMKANIQELNALVPRIVQGKKNITSFAKDK